MSYGDDVRAARKQMKMTQDEAADLAGVSRRYYLEIEHSRANVSVEVLQRVAHALGVRELQLADVRARFGSPAVVTAIVAKIDRVEALLHEVRDAMQGGASDLGAIVEDLRDVAADRVGEAGDFSFADSVGAEELAFRAVAAVPTSALLVSEALFRAVDFTYPSVVHGHVLRAEVLGGSMAPLLEPGDAIHIDTSVRTPHPGVVLAVHSAVFGSAMGRVPMTGERVLLREHGNAVLLGTGSCVVIGAVEKAA
jgi:transcriptional regulator with XRE-family HTH domain